MFPMEYRFSYGVHENYDVVESEDSVLFLQGSGDITYSFVSDFLLDDFVVNCLVLDTNCRPAVMDFVSRWGLFCVGNQERLSHYLDVIGMVRKFYTAEDWGADDCDKINDYLLGCRVGLELRDSEFISVMYPLNFLNVIGFEMAMLLTGCSFVSYNVAINLERKNSKYFDVFK